MNNTYLSLDNLEVYQLAIQLSDISWNIYIKLDWQDKKTMGDQFIRSTDSVGAKIAEGYGRFHYLDKVKFYYNARGSLLESKHWLDLMKKREKVSNKKQLDTYISCYTELHPKLN